MSICRNPDAEAAIQYLTWALEELAKTGNQKAAHHARTALEELRRTLGSGESDKPGDVTTSA